MKPDNAVILLLMIISATLSLNTHSEELGRLFTTPEQRAELDAMRNIGPPEVREQKKEERKIRVNKKVVYDDINLNGIVKRNDGRNTLWIGNTVVESGVSDEQGIVYSVEKDNSALITLPDADNKQVRLQTGKSYDPMNNKVRSLIDSENNKTLSE